MSWDGAIPVTAQEATSKQQIKEELSPQCIKQYLGCFGKQQVRSQERIHTLVVNNLWLWLARAPEVVVPGFCAGISSDTGHEIPSVGKALVVIVASGILRRCKAHHGLGSII